MEKNIKNKVVLKKGTLKKYRGDSKLITELALCVIAIALIVVFKDKMSGVMTSIFTTVSKTVTDLFSTGVVK